MLPRPPPPLSWRPLRRLLSAVASPNEAQMGSNGRIRDTDAGVHPRLPKPLSDRFSNIYYIYGGHLSVASVFFFSFSPPLRRGAGIFLEKPCLISVSRIHGKQLRRFSPSAQIQFASLSSNRPGYFSQRIDDHHILRIRYWARLSPAIFDCSLSFSNVHVMGVRHVV